MTGGRPTYVALHNKSSHNLCVAAFGANYKVFLGFFDHRGQAALPTDRI
jgi:hypothetical protein